MSKQKKHLGSAAPVFKLFTPDVLKQWYFRFYLKLVEQFSAVWLHGFIIMIFTK